jgi:hypothetical protein
MYALSLSFATMLSSALSYARAQIWLTSYARDDPVLLSGLIPLPFNVPVRLNHTDEFEVVKAKFLLELADVAGDHPFSAFVPVSPIKKPAEEEKKKKKKEEAQPENKEEEEKKTPARKRSLFSSTENEPAARKRPRRASASASSASSVASVASVAEGVEDGEAAATIAPDVSVGDEWKCDKCKFKTSAAHISWINRHQNQHKE